MSLPAKQPNGCQVQGGQVLGSVEGQRDLWTQHCPGRRVSTRSPFLILEGTRKEEPSL